MKTIEYFPGEKTPDNIYSITETKFMTADEISKEFPSISFKDKMEVKILQQEYNNTMYKIQKLIEDEQDHKNK